MSFEQPVIASGSLRAVRPNGTWEVVMANGFVVIAHLSPSLRLRPPHFSPGDRITLELTPYDFTHGRITGCWERGESSPADGGSSATKR